MFCPKCGTKNEDGAMFCLSCGAKLEEENAPVNNAQAAPQVQPGQQAPVAPAAPKAPKVRKPLTKKTIGLIAAAAAVVVLVVVFIVIGKGYSNYEKLAEKYFVAVMDCDWDKVVDYIDVPDGDFMSADILKAVKKDVTAKELSNYVVKNMSDEEQKIYDALGLDSSDTSEDGVTKDVRIEYRIKGESSNNTQTVECILLKDKALLFFDQYKISPDNLVASNFTITVLKDATVTIDGIAVEDKYLSTETTTKSSSSSSSSSNTKKTYKINHIYKGTHTIKITNPGYEDYETTYSISGNGASYSYTTAKLNEDTIKKIASQAETNFKEIYTGATKRNAFSSISGLCVSDSTYKSKLESAYETFMNKTMSTDGYGITDIKWNSVTGSGSQTTNSNGDTAIKVSVKANADYTVKTKSVDSKTYTNKSITWSMYYTLENGNWKLYSVSYSKLY